MRPATNKAAVITIFYLPHYSLQGGINNGCIAIMVFNNSTLFPTNKLCVIIVIRFCDKMIVTLSGSRESVGHCSGKFRYAALFCTLTQTVDTNAALYRDAVLSSVVKTVPFTKKFPQKS